MSDISIKFIAENEVYSVGWIVCVRSGLQYLIDNGYKFVQEGDIGHAIR